jgi:AcrR family transcriptional regulator
MRAEERRLLALRAAVVEFGRSGYQATSTASIADRMGVSQPYLFRLFVSKKALFTAAADWCLAEVCKALDAAAEGSDSGADALEAMARTYAQPPGVGPDFLRFQLALYGATADPDLRAAARRHFEALWTTVRAASGAGDRELREFFGEAALRLVLTSIDEVAA